MMNNMQANKVQTTPFRMSEKLGVLPVNEQACEANGISMDQFLRMDFSITVIDDELVLRGTLPKDKPLSNNTPDVTGDLQP